MEDFHAPPAIAGRNQFPKLLKKYKKKQPDSLRLSGYGTGRKPRQKKRYCGNCI
jgi:hypothetical protein